MIIQVDQYTKRIGVEKRDITLIIYRSVFVSSKNSIRDTLKDQTPIFCNTFINGIERK